MAADGISQGLKQSRRFANPIGKGLTIQVEPFTLEDLALAENGKWSAYLLTST